MSSYNLDRNSGSCCVQNYRMHSRLYYHNLQGEGLSDSSHPIRRLFSMPTYGSHPAERHAYPVKHYGPLQVLAGSSPPTVSALLGRRN
jgi:hypothetical protein